MIGTTTSAPRKIGTLFTFKPDSYTKADGTLVEWPTFEAGALTKRDAKQDNGEKPVKDDREGSRVNVAMVQTGYAPSWDLTTANTNAFMMALYHRSGPPVAWTQAASSFTDVPHRAWANSVVQLVDANGLPLVMVSALTSLKVGGSTAVRGIDYDYSANDLERGLIYTLPTSTLLTAAGATAITISGSLAAVTGGYEIKPMSGGCTVTGYGHMHAAACEGASRISERGRYAITFPSMDWPLDDVATVSLTVTKLADIGGAYPYGRVLLTKGAV